ncbi:MAG TPA: DUF2029 domain-containing protein [Dehalococcoidia bacterium]|nr:DUF2029 domain-containing protein [Dehalococcoidia bacterium]
MSFEKIAGIIQSIKKKPLLFFIFLHALLFLAVSANLDGIVGDCEVERLVATNILDGQAPYRDFSAEYPPIAIISFLLPALISSAQPFYSILFAFEMLLFDIVVLLLLAKFASRLDMKIWKVLGVYTLCIISAGVVVTGRYDLLPATLVLVALYAFASGRNKTAWALLALGLMAKVYPIIIAPFFAIYLLRFEQYRKLAQGIAVFVIVAVIISLPCILLDAGGYWQSISYHMERGLHIESSYGSVLLVGQILGLTQTTGEFSYGSWNLDSPMADNLAQISIYITIGLLFLTYAIYARWLWRKTALDNTAILKMSSGEMQTLLRYSLLAIVMMLLGSKLFSPQFIIWLCPLLPLVKVRWRYVLPVLFLIIGGISQYIYPHNYIELEMVLTHTVVLLAIRNCLLLVMAVILLLPLRNPPANGEKEATALTPSGIT